MTGYMDDIKKYYQNIIDTYGFDFVVINDARAALVGNGFAITIGISIDGADISYICKNKLNEFEEYWFDTFIAQVNDDNDYIGLQKPQNIYEKIIFELEITARVLFNHWKNILQGDKTWINQFLLEDDENEAEPVNDIVIKILEPYFNKRNIK
ncbi:MAG: hypothetical protein GYA50_10185 [Eubacteriaceae bacterium]|nr:hypothetical protein [Eubacteriaceae bacterium]